MTTNIDYLSEDTLIDPNQKFICISFLTDTNNKSSLSGIKIRGAFETYELACAHAKKLQQIDPYFNVFVGDMGKWLPFNPDPDNIKESEYANEELNKMMKSYLENQEKAKLFHQQRKTELMRESIINNLKIKQTNLNEIKEKITDLTEQKEKLPLENNISTIEEQISEMDKQLKELTDTLDTINKDIKQYTQHSISDYKPNIPKHFK